MVLLLLLLSIKVVDVSGLIKLSMSIVEAVGMRSERDTITREVRRREMLMGCMGNWIGRTSELSKGGIVGMCVCKKRVKEVFFALSEVRRSVGGWWYKEGREGEIDGLPGASVCMYVCVNVGERGIRAIKKERSGTK